MPGIVVGYNESIDSVLERFKKQVEKGGVFSEIGKREFYEKPSERKKKRLFASKKGLCNKGWKKLKLQKLVLPEF